MAKYIMQEMPDVRGNGKRTTYPKMIIEHQVELRRLAREIADGTTFGVGEVEGIICTLVSKMANYMAWGYSVRVNGMGAFAPALQLKAGAEREDNSPTRRNATSIEIGGVHFRPDRELIEQIARGCKLERAKPRRYTSPSTGREERTALALSHLHTHGRLSVAEYIGMTGLSRTSAVRELAKLREAGTVAMQGRGSHSFYTLPALNPGE